MAENFGLMCARRISTCKVLLDNLSKPLPCTPTHKKSTVYLEKFFYFVCLPLCALTTVTSLTAEKEKPPEFVRYSYLRIRTKKFPWGDGNKTLFHNPKVNALPDGYEK